MIRSYKFKFLILVLLLLGSIIITSHQAANAYYGSNLKWSDIFVFNAPYSGLPVFNGLYPFNYLILNNIRNCGRLYIYDKNILEFYDFAGTFRMPIFNFWNFGDLFYALPLTRAQNVLLTPGGGIGPIISPTTTTLPTTLFLPVATPFIPFLSTINTLPSTTTAPTVIITPLTFDPSGYYTGIWTSLITFNSNSMTLNVVNVDPFTYSSLAGTACLLLNEVIPIPVDVTGIYTSIPTTITIIAPGVVEFILSGTYLNPVSLVNYTLELICTYGNTNIITGTTVLPPRVIEGTYTIYDPLNIIIDHGIFYTETYGYLL